MAGPRRPDGHVETRSVRTVDEQAGTSAHDHYIGPEMNCPKCESDNVSVHDTGAWCVSCRAAWRIPRMKPRYQKTIDTKVIRRTHTVCVYPSDTAGTIFDAFGQVPRSAKADTMAWADEEDH